MTRRISLAALAILLSGCATIETVNGVRMNATTAPDATYCDRNRTICILFGVAFIGGLGAIFAANSDHHNAPPSAPLPPPF